MVQVSETGKVFASVNIFAERVAVGGSPLLGGSLVVIGTDVSRLQLVGDPLIGLCREVYPVGHVATMVDDDVGNGADAFGLESLNHRAQLMFSAKGTVVVSWEPIERIVAHRGVRGGLCTLGNPYQFEIL